MSYTDLKNHTTMYHFSDILEQYQSGLAVVPLLAFMEAIAIGKGKTMPGSFYRVFVKFGKSQGIHFIPWKVREFSDKSGKSQGIHFIPWKVREKSGNLVISQGKIREFTLSLEN